MAYDANFGLWVCEREISTPAPVYGIGDTGPGGGVVFYTYADGTHGLEISPDDVGISQTGVGWGCYGTNLPGAGSQEIGDGQANTRWILAGCPTENTAADQAASFSLGGFDDWFLPTALEMLEYYHQQTLLPPLRYNVYWTSSESGHRSALVVDFLNGWPGIVSKREDALNPHGVIGVRAVRAF